MMEMKQEAINNEESLEATDEVVEAVENSRGKPRGSFIPHEEIKREFLESLGSQMLKRRKV